MQDFLPVTRKEMKERGWEQADFVYVTGDAYVGRSFFRYGNYQPAAGKQGI